MFGVPSVCHEHLHLTGTFTEKLFKMARLFSSFVFLFVLIVCFAALATSFPLNDHRSSSGEALGTVKSSLTSSKEQTLLSRSPRGLGLGLGYRYGGYGGYGGYYPCYTFLGCMLNAKRMFLGSKCFELLFHFCIFSNQILFFVLALGGIFRPRPWGYYGYY